MHKVNELLGLDVLDQDTGEKRGTVKDLIFDDHTTRIVALVLDGGGLFGGAKTVRWGHVVNVGDVVMLAGGAPLDGSRDDPEIYALRGRQRRITGTEIVTEGGQKEGEVADVLLDDGGVVRAYEVKRGVIRDLAGRELVPAEDVISSGPDAIVVRDQASSGPEDAVRP